MLFDFAICIAGLHTNSIQLSIYLPADVQCLQRVDPFLENHHLVLQMEDFGSKSLVNSAIAGTVWLHFWKVWQQVIFDRQVLNLMG